MCHAMPTVRESVCCAEIGQVWQRVENQRPEIQMKCITEHPRFLSTCLDVWELENCLLIMHSDSSTAKIITQETSVFTLI